MLLLCYHFQLLLLAFINHGIQVLAVMRYDILIAAPVGVTNGTDGQFRIDPGTQYSMEIAMGSRKRRHTDQDESDEETNDSSLSAPINDIYRSRQQKKVKWWNKKEWPELDTIICFVWGSN